MVSKDLKDKYWNILRRTRKSGRISASVIERVEESWKKYDDDVVEEALTIHISHYKNYKENYTIGIMRNLQKKKAESAPVKQVKKNSFNNFHQREYDYDELEKRLIMSDL